MAVGGGDALPVLSYAPSEIPRRSQHTSATWSSPVRILPGINHLNVEISGHVNPVFSAVQSEGQSAVDVGALFAKYLPGTIDVQDILSGLKQLWETQREFLAPGMSNCLVTSPVITPTGGLILQLCDEKEAGSVVSIPNSAPAISVYGDGNISGATEVTAPICTSSLLRLMRDSHH